MGMTISNSANSTLTAHSNRRPILLWLATILLSRLAGSLLLHTSPHCRVTGAISKCGSVRLLLRLQRRQGWIHTIRVLELV
jgi:hypothetical protein